MRIEKVFINFSKFILPMLIYMNRTYDKMNEKEAKD